MGATVPIRDRLIGATPVGITHERAVTMASFPAMRFAGRRVSAWPITENSSNNAWRQTFSTSSPGNQNNNNKNNNNRARAVRRSAAPCDVTIEELFQAYYDCRKRKRSKESALLFEQNLERNLMRLYEELHDGSYHPGETTAFAVLKPKPREVWAADFRDRIVHHLLYNRVSADFYRRFTVDSCACIPGRGTLYAVNRLERHLRSATQNWTMEKWVLQMDIANFFVSIDKDVLRRQLTARIAPGYTRDLALQLLDHDPTTWVKINSPPERMAMVPAHKSLFHSRGKGLPIGNLTSQFFANVYLDELDQYAKRALRLTHYVRYVDDLVVILDSQQQCLEVADQLRSFARDTLHVDFHPQKTHIQKANQGVNFVGFVVRPFARYVRRRTLGSAHHLFQTGRHDLQRINSYLGLMRHCNSYRHRQRLTDKARACGYRIHPQLTKVIIHARDRVHLR